MNDTVPPTIENRLEIARGIGASAAMNLIMDGRDGTEKYFSDLENICSWKAFLLLQEGLTSANIELMMEVYGPAQMALRG